MAGEVREIRAEHVPGMLGSVSAAEREIVLNAAANSRPLWGGFWNGEPLCIFGLIPPTLLSETAYLWLLALPEAARHRVIFGRWGRRMVAQMLELYPVLVGHCIGGRGEAWLASLGARLEPRDSNITTFEIAKWQQR